MTEPFPVLPLGGAKGFFSTPNFSERAGPGTRWMAPFDDGLWPLQTRRAPSGYSAKFGGQGPPSEIFFEIDLTFFGSGDFL